MRRLFSGLMIVFCIVGWIMLFTNKVQEKKEYDSTLQTAYMYAEKGLPYKSAQYFTKALSDNMDQNIYKSYLVQLYSLNSNEIYYSTLDIYLKRFPQDVEAYSVLFKKYDSINNYGAYFDLYKRAKEAGVLTEEVSKRYKELFYEASFMISKLEEAKSYVGEYAQFKMNEHWGLLGSNGQIVVQPRYDSIDVILGGAYPVSLDGVAYFLAENGEKHLTTNKPVEWLSLIADGCCVARKGEKYALCDTGINVPENFEYDFLSVSSSGVLAAKKGDKWALIRSNGEPITEFLYEDILIDPDRQCCIRNGVIFAKTNGKYIMLDANGVRIGTESFDEAKMFASSQPAAIKKGDKWGFVNADGTLNGGVKYDEIGSFSLGLFAARDEEGNWGYKDATGEYVISPIYQECRPFASNGRALVKKDDLWGFITVRGFEMAK